MGTSIELLANEIILDVFEYLTTEQLFHALYDLNERFNQLLFTHFQFHGKLDFESLSKTSLNIIYQHYLPTNFHRIRSIHLVDRNEIPEQIEQFLSLKSLSLSCISSEKRVRHIFTILPHFHHLTYLTIFQCYLENDLVDDGWIFHQIWSLPNLTYCHLERKQYFWNPFFISPKIVSSSIKFLYLRGFLYTFEELHNLFFYTTNLKDLNIDIEHNYNYHQNINRIY